MEIIAEYLTREEAGIAGLIVMGVLLGIGLLIRAKGFSVFGPPKASPVEAKIDKTVGSILRRVDRIEADLEQRPTRSELHAVQNSITRLDERVTGVMRTTEKTSQTVTRIEDFLLSLAKDSR